MTFEEALEYLRKGYFIHEVADYNTYYFVVNGCVFSINTKKYTCMKVANFSSYFTLNSLWYVVPMGKQLERGFNDDK